MVLSFKLSLSSAAVDNHFIGRQFSYPQVIYLGDSLTLGYGAEHPYSRDIVLTDWCGQKVSSTNLGISGLKISDMYHNSDINLNILYNFDSALNIVVIWGGTNDIADGVSVLQTYSYLREFCQYERRLGFRVFVMTMISRTGLEKQKNQFNDLIRNDWKKFSDGIIDVAANASIGADGACSDKAYFNEDGIHLNDAGYAVVCLIAQNALNNFIKSDACVK